MPRCSDSGHLCAAAPIAVYWTAPPNGKGEPDRYRLRLCQRHGHALLSLGLKRGANLLAEQDLPEFCLGCARPTDGDVHELRWFEGDWSLSLAFTLCGDCGTAPLDALTEGAASAEKLPPRERTPERSPRRRR